MLLLNQIGENALDEHLTHNLAEFRIVSADHAFQILETEDEVGLVRRVDEVVNLSS